MKPYYYSIAKQMETVLMHIRAIWFILRCFKWLLSLKSVN